MFLRKSTTVREPLPLVMSGVRLGERLLQIGLADTRLVTMLAAKPGISGRAALIVGDDKDAVRAQSAAAEAGILIETHVARDRFPFDDGSFDVAILHGGAVGRADRPTIFRECLRALRTGGRLVVFDRGARGGLGRLLSNRRRPDMDATETLAALELAGFDPVRLLADREGYQFTEGLRTRA